MDPNEFMSSWTNFCNCINFGASALNADAIRFMNEAPRKIFAALKYCKESNAQLKGESKYVLN